MTTLMFMGHQMIFFLGCLVKEKKYYRVSACFFEQFCSDSRIRTSAPAFLCCHWSISPMYKNIAGFQNNFQNHSRCFRETLWVTGFLKARTSFLKRATWRIFVISNWFSEASRSLFLIFSTKRPPYVVLFGNINAVLRSVISQVEIQEYMFRIFVTAPKKQQPYLLK